MASRTAFTASLPLHKRVAAVHPTRAVRMCENKKDDTAVEAGKAAGPAKYQPIRTVKSSASWKNVYVDEFGSKGPGSRPDHDLRPISERSTTTDSKDAAICASCAGTGTRLCSFCEGVEFIANGKPSKCPACNGVTTVTCSSCYGTAKQVELVSVAAFVRASLSIVADILRCCAIVRLMVAKGHRSAVQGVARCRHVRSCVAEIITTKFLHPTAAVSFVVHFCIQKYHSKQDAPLVEMHDILPSNDAEQLIDFTCELPWERFALDIELAFRAWKLGATTNPSPPIGESGDDGGRNSVVAGLEAPALASRRVALGNRTFILQLRSDSNDTTLDAAPLQRLVGEHTCVMLLSSKNDAPVAWDISDAVSLLSALTAAANACDVQIALLVAVGRASEFRLLGRRGGDTPARYCGDCLAYVPTDLGHLAGLLALFQSKRAAARRCRIAPKVGHAYIAAKFSYTWSDFSLRVPPPLGTQFAKTLAVAHDAAFELHDPVRSLRIAALWDSFPASELQRNTDRAAMRAATADRIRIAPNVVAAGRCYMPLAAPIRSFARYALRIGNASDAAAQNALVDVASEGRDFDIAFERFFIETRHFLAAAALDTAINADYVLSAVAALFDVSDAVGEVGDALGPIAHELSLVERLARLCAPLDDADSVRYLWALFVDVVTMHWFYRKEINGVETLVRDGPQLSVCLLEQKLQMINCCIHRETTQVEQRVQRTHDVYGRKQRIQGVTLVNDDEVEVWEPFVQPPAYLTSDLVEAAHLRIVAGDEGVPQSKEELRTLTSDMAAFKAANPQALMHDFVRWFSPSDWIANAGDDVQNTCETESNSESLGSGHLSARMRKPGNEWEVLWRVTEAKPVHEQPALFDATIHATRAIESLRNAPLSPILLQLGAALGYGTSCLLYNAFPTATLPLVRALAEQAKNEFRSFASIAQLSGDIRQFATLLNNAASTLIEAERAALVVKSLRAKLPDAGQFRSAIDSIAVGLSYEISGASELALLASIARLDDNDWRNALLPEHREFLIKGDCIKQLVAQDERGIDGDRMYARLSSDEFRTAFRLCIDYDA